MNKTKRAIVLGAGGFIGSHMVKRLKAEGYWTRGVDLAYPEFSAHQADDYIIGDLRDKNFVAQILNHSDGFDELYQFAADMGGAGYIFTDDHSAEIMHNSVMINLNVLEAVRNYDGKLPKIFYSSSACVYPADIQEVPENPGLREEHAYPSNPDSEYGWEKLFSERLYLAFGRNHNLDIRIARYHNIYGPESSYKGGKEKSPAAICRKVASVVGNSGEIECWGDGEQTRSFLYIDDCIQATRLLMQSQHKEVVNIGSDEMISINQLINYAAKAAGKDITIKHIDGPQGVRGRNSQNDRIREHLGWQHKISFEQGIRLTYSWVSKQI